MALSTSSCCISSERSWGSAPMPKGLERREAPRRRDRQPASSACRSSTGRRRRRPRGGMMDCPKLYLWHLWSVECALLGRREALTLQDTLRMCDSFFSMQFLPDTGTPTLSLDNGTNIGSSLIEQIGVDPNVWIRRANHLEKVFEFAILNTLLAYETPLGDSAVLSSILHIHLCHQSSESVSLVY
jgi:hypothetical protein